MRIAFISDIHANMEAFTQVLADIDKSDIDAVYCLGDIVGYGPEPNQVVELIYDRNIPTVIGNHEMAVIDPEYLRSFNPFARDSLRKTIRLLSKDAIKFIRNLKPFIVVHDCRLVHGFPPDSPVTYLTHVSEKEIHQAFNQIEERFCYSGHTHELEIIAFDNRSITRTLLSSGTTCLYGENRYMISIGSVGQPRDGNNNAKYVIWDTSADIIDVRFIPYDISAVVDKIIAAGLPRTHARRLR
jgi:predicted phosphodiesterase